MQRTTFNPVTYVLQHFQTSKEAGHKALQALLKAKQLPVTSYLDLIFHLLAENKKEAMMVIPRLPLRFEELLNSLIQLNYTPHQFDQLIDFLVQNKIFNKKHFLKIYDTLGKIFTEKQNLLGIIHYNKLTLTVPNLPIKQKMIATINLAMGYEYNNEGEKADLHAREAYSLEEKFNITGCPSIIDVYLKLFNESIMDNLHEANVGFLWKAFGIAAKDSRIIRATEDFIKKSIGVLNTSPHPKLFELAVVAAQFLPEEKKMQAAICKTIRESKAEHYDDLVRARCMKGAGNVDEAIKFLRQALQKNPDNHEVLIGLGECFVDKGTPQEAIEPLLTVMTMEPSAKEQLEVCIYLTQAYFELRNFSEVVRYATEVIELDPNADKIDNTIARLVTALMHLNEIKKAKDIYANARLRFPQSKVLDECSERLFFKNNPPLALNKKASIETILAEACAHFARSQSQHHAAGKVKMEYLQQKHPNTEKYHFALYGFYELIEKDYVSAIKHLKLAGAPLIYTEKLMTLNILIKDYKEAESLAWYTLQHTGKKYKNDLAIRKTAYRGLGFVCDQTERYSQSIKDIDQFLQQDKNLPKEDLVEINLLLAKFHYYLENFVAAEKYATAALQLMPTEKSEMSFYFLGCALYQQGKFKQAIDPLQRYQGQLQKVFPMLSMMLGVAFYFADPITYRDHILANLHKALSSDLSLMTALLEILPSEIISVLQENLEAKEEKISIPVTPVIQSESTVASLPLSLPPKLDLELSGSKVFTPTPSVEKILHLCFQAEKQRQQRELKQQFHIEEKQEEAGWDIPGEGFVKVSDSRVSPIVHARHSSSTAHLYSFMHQKKLEQACSLEECKEIQDNLRKGRVVSKVDKQGIRFLDSDEQRKVAKKLHEDGYLAKYKSESTLLSNSRIFANCLSSRGDGREKLLCFDRVIKKSHPG